MKHFTFVLSSIMAVVLLLAGQSVYASDTAQNSNNQDVVTAYIYALTITTADVEDAGTNSNIYAQLIGTGGSSPQVLLDRPGYNDFERGATDTYYISADQNLGTITSIKMYTDGTGYKPGWFPTFFKVEHNASTWNFLNGQWVGVNGSQTFYPNPIP
ncbi:PLAT/LH2 domain-containing protein [Brevibacillus laterosporus]|uniref:PLAT/LH2 domain-containing protein n=1 Tax=Brevibacillus laterosporus TaxID=1465 RepID=UPI002652188D|nr:PLAT/LH2 domain-containing protein [Brevibacillus laterosporus]MDN9012880.1 PLAT/LH2 domain-containing protein [Brevibacillus laterosporus]MDO0943957.1 PLAT/LH2 domain-containing protein [Brevibacillus laterosporus]